MIFELDVEHGALHYKQYNRCWFLNQKQIYKYDCFCSSHASTIVSLAATTLRRDHAPPLRQEIFRIVAKCSGDQKPLEDVWIFAQIPKLWKLENCDITEISK